MNLAFSNDPGEVVIAPDAQFRSNPNLARIALLFLFWFVVFFLSLQAPPLLDDADATHAQAAQAMLRSGDWVTLHVDGVRYLEKAPLPYWIAACSLRLFHETAFAIHLPLALAVLGLAALGYAWARHAFDERTAFATALLFLTSVGPFLFTRVFLPDALLSFFLAGGLYCLQRSLDRGKPAAIWPYGMWTCMALAVLTKGLIAIVFLLATGVLTLGLSRVWGRWRALRAGTGSLLLLAIAGPWHVLAGVRNRGGAHGHGFFWFYFMNEHVLRFLGRREPRDYNKVPTLLFWFLHAVWLFPWSFFLPLAAVVLWRKRHRLLAFTTEAQRSFVTLACFSIFVLLFFSFSTNQEYYTFPLYLPLSMLLAASLREDFDMGFQRVARWCSAALAATGTLLAAALGYGLWQARGLPSNTDLGSVLLRRGVGNYTLSLSHFFDLTGASFAALRLPAALACAALLLGPLLAYYLQRRGFLPRAMLVLASGCAVWLIAAHIALERFAPVLSSYGLAQEITELRRTHRIEPETEVLLFGDQALGSSLPFYLRRNLPLVNGRSSSLLFGSTFPDSAGMFLTEADLNASWGRNSRKLLFVPAEQHEAADRLLGRRAIVVAQLSGKELLTDRPLANTNEVH